MPARTYPSHAWRSLSDRPRQPETSRSRLALKTLSMAGSLLLLVLVGQVSSAADWLQFRGPGGAGVAASAAPTEWGTGDNVIWQTPLPGPGTSSPILVGDRIYLTCYSGYGLDPNRPGEMEQLTRHLVQLDRKTGEIQRTQRFQPQLPESAYAGGNDSRHGYSSSTPVSDGERLYLFFGKSGVFCTDLDGGEIWHANVGTKTRGWGSSNSPVLYRNLLIVNASVESGRLIALDKLSGREVWSTGGMRSSWSTPALVELENGETELVVSVQKWVLGLDPATGEELWRCEGIPTYVCPSVISEGGVAYITGGRGTQYTLAVRAGGRGDVTDTHLLWRVNKGSNVSSPVVVDGHVFVIRDRGGVAYCFDAETGRIQYEQRLPGQSGTFYASATAAGGNVYYTSQHDGTFVVAANPDFALVARNEFEEDARSNASLVVDEGQLLLRNDQFLYCIGAR